MTPEPRVVVTPEELFIEGMPQVAVGLRRKCNAPAPLVVNGAAYVGCQLDTGHDGQHAIKIEWAR